MTIGYSPKFPLSFSDEGGYSLNKDIISVVKQNFKNLMLTVPGERIFDSNFGVGLKRFLFEPRNENTFSKIRNRIYSQIEEYMPFLEIKRINFAYEIEQENALFIEVEYFIKNISTIDSISLSVR